MWYTQQMVGILCAGRRLHSLHSNARFTPICPSGTTLHDCKVQATSLWRRFQIDKTTLHGNLHF